MKSAPWAGLAASAIAVLSFACDDGDKPAGSEGPVRKPTVRLVMEEGVAPILRADGLSTLTIAVHTDDAEGQPESKDVQVTASGGTLGADSGVSDDGRTLQTRTSEGRATFGFTCAVDDPQEVTLRATAGEATTVRKVLCVWPGVFPALSLAASADAPLSGESVTLTAEVFDASGLRPGTEDNPSFRPVRFTVDDAETVLSRAAVIPSNGVAEVEAVMPNLAAGEAQRYVSVTAIYQPTNDGPPLVSTVTLHVVSPTLLVIEPSLSRGVIRSDFPATSDEAFALLEVTIRRQGTPVQLAVTFTVAAGDTERIGFGTPPSLTLSQTLMTNMLGQASLRISPRDAMVRGRASVEISVVDTMPDPDTTVRTTVQVEVDRAPIARTLAFVNASPSFIGVLGSARPTSTLVSFSLRDDLDQPMPAVAVRFDLPTSADPDATVVAQGLTSTDGVVSTVLSSGRLAAPLQVRARVATPTATFTALSDPVPVIAGLPSFANSYIVCEGVVHEAGTAADCTAVIADRFTNRASDMAVQFRSEGGNMTPFGLTDDASDGEVSGVRAKFLPGTPGTTSPDVLDWTYGRLIPLDEGDVTPPLADLFDPAGCFDGSTATTCDLFTMCREGSLPEYCPLPNDDRTGPCWQDIPPLGLELMGVNTERCTSSITSGNRTISCDDATFVTLQGLTVTPLQYVRNAAVATAVDALRANSLNCGFPITCLTGNNGFDFISGDECAPAVGCFDFDPRTPCPHAGLVTLAATARGEESFVDHDGNGEFDYTDMNSNGRHDLGEPVAEPWADMPESYLDKNDSCTFDDYSGHARLEPYEEIRLSDLFSDEDESGDFGYRDPTSTNPAALRSFTNRSWDNDRELLLTTRQIYLDSDPYQLSVGELCTPADVLLGPDGFLCANGVMSTCVQVGADFGLAYCRPAFIVDPQLVAAAADYSAAAQYANAPTERYFDHVWADSNGNCASPNLEAKTTATHAGPLQILGTSQATLDGGYCGVAATGSGARNSYRPWCEEYWQLGAKPLEARVVPDCREAGGLTVASVTFTHSEGKAVTYLTPVMCPWCGDGILTDGEQCDPAVLSGEPGYFAGCSITCTF